jgi:hypothetical protein
MSLITDQYKISLKHILNSLEENVFNPYREDIKINKDKIMKMNSLLFDLGNKKLNYSDYKEIRKLVASRGGFITSEYRNKYYLKRITDEVTISKSELDFKTIDIIEKDVKRSLINQFSFLCEGDKYIVITLDRLLNRGYIT